MDEVENFLELAFTMAEVELAATRVPCAFCGREVAFVDVSSHLELDCLPYDWQPKFDGFRGILGDDGYY